ncbi:uncharacterized protein LOC134762828 [Penaeus indicus]|uniref:uncharacterized protein LOC134762828 n=1 Tax=Penaeus indicus TaxID=29960 RepID=UPI00300D3FB4
MRLGSRQTGTFNAPQAGTLPHSKDWHVQHSLPVLTPSPTPQAGTLNTPTPGWHPPHYLPIPKAGTLSTPQSGTLPTPKTGTLPRLAPSPLPRLALSPTPQAGTLPHSLPRLAPSPLNRQAPSQLPRRALSPFPPQKGTLPTPTS